MNYEALRAKKDFIESLNYSFMEFESGTSVREIKYYVFENGIEYVVLEFKGGAICARNCTGSSQVAVFQEIAKMLNGGYYEEVKYFKEYLYNLDLLDIY